MPEKGENAVPEEKEIRDIIYWYASDYCDVFLADGSWSRSIRSGLLPQI